ncbi:uncharacterized protein ARMOST_19245 [Armillaria ostoyae]|uniref:CxC2-like cysteine cluster KDZ transposase-associated domain-containing protein n=1 Tax=Armillaria ostoyae TaxID=47428 RepID=A0A284S407_ARMOS|nr:uncharacterized protein ARMOST_19245 [Armillaria ostoyae]
MPAFEIHNGKRVRVGGRSGVAGYSNCLDLDDDFEVIVSHESSISARGRLVQAPPSPQKGRTTWVIGDSWSLKDDTEIFLDPTDQWYDEELQGEIYESRVFQQAERETPAKKKRKRSKVSKWPHIVWKDLYRSEYLDELLRLEGRGKYRKETSCPDCIAHSKGDASALGTPSVQCRDCFLDDLVCPACCVRRHRREPLHRIESWNGDYFEPTTLRNIVPGHQEFKVLHGNGIHHVALDYCGCERQLPKHIQLLRRGWYPASQHVPHTAASFQLLEFLHMLSLCAKSSLYDFYRTLEKLTVNTGIDVPKSRNKALMRMLLQWRHLKMLKRGGRAHFNDGVVTTGPHNLAVLCPSCPCPGINLPEGWEEALPELRFLYVLIICMDANFCLKNQMVSSYSCNPGLRIGLGYFVPQEAFDTFVLNHTSDEDISTCVGFAVLAKADTKFSKVRLVNLHKGERYAPMDYVFGSTLMTFTGLLQVIISYDIACQWFINLSKRMAAWPTKISGIPQANLTPTIPKFHEPAHKQENHQEFSCNFIKGMGNSDCEVPERLWGPNNQIGNSTKTMGPGSRHDVLDDTFGFWNWMKYVTMGLPEKLIAEWETVCIQWENDGFPKTVENPFAVNQDYMSEVEVEKELEAEEQERRRQGGHVLHATSADKFIVLALSLEESQRKVRELTAQHKNPTTRQGTSLKEQHSILKDKLRNWLILAIILRAIYIPGLIQYLTEIGEPSGEHGDENPEDVKLWLPSHLPGDRRRVVCMEGLPAIEERLRVAQCHDALNGIRHTLRLKTRMIHFRNKNTRGQRPSTRARAVIDGVHQRALAFATKYRTARTAKLALSGPGEWEDTLLVLENKDIRSYTDVERKKRGLGCRGNNEDNDKPTHAMMSLDFRGNGNTNSGTRLGN